MNNERQATRMLQAPEVSRHRSLHRAASTDGVGRHRLLRVMKFGGTSVGDAECIRRVVEIIQQSHIDSDLILVVSAMAGVTNSLIEAAAKAKAGNIKETTEILERLRQRHVAALNSLIECTDERNRLMRTMDEALRTNEQLCQGTALVGELTPRVKDSISSLGERLCAPIVAAALRECGVRGQAIDATEVIATNANHGAADPIMNRTRELCEMRLRPLLQQAIVPVVTGFIGATADRVLTTLGRGGSDYSATILAAALNADEVVIWTDVDGLLTADPRVIPGAYTIPEVSYREASELAYFGAKVLHPKTLRSLNERGIPVWIRNTFSPESPGTKITKAGPASGSCAAAITTISEAALISVALPAVAAPDISAKVHAVASAASSDIFLLSQSSAQNDLSLVVPASTATAIIEALKRDFAAEIACANSEQTIFEVPVALLTVVGEKLQSSPTALVRLLSALGRESISILAVATGPTDCKISLVVTRKDLRLALIAAHREFEVPPVHLAPLPPVVQPALWRSPVSQPHSDAD